LSVVRVDGLRWRDIRDVVFLLGLVTIFVIQFITAIAVIQRPHDSGQVRTIAVLIVVCFLVGIARAWELIGGPSIGLKQEIGVRVRRHHRDADSARDK